MSDHLRNSDSHRRLSPGRRVATWGAALIAVIAIVSPPGIAVADSATASATAKPEAPEALDVVFVLDNSGSMRQNDPEFLTRRAVSDFIDALAQDSNIDGRIALVLFDGRAQLAQRLTSATSIASTQRLDTTLSALDFSGQQTNSPAGIERALYELREHGRSDARKAIVFLSDGRIDTGDAQRDVEVARWLREDLAKESEASSVRIFGIAFTDEADYQLMQALAQRTRARYYRAFAASEISTVVDDVLATLSAPPVYDLAFIENPTARRDGAAGPPDVAASPIPDLESGDSAEGWNLGLLAWIPILLLLVAAPLVVRWRGFNRLAPFQTKQSVDAPSAQLLDVGGHVIEAGSTLPLATDRTRIGRDPNNDIVIENDTISSEHAMIEVRDGRYWLQDLRSTNGTRLSDHRLAKGESTPLKGGDHIRFADIDLMFVVEGYVPGGATVYLTSSTPPPAEWSVLVDTPAAVGTESDSSEAAEAAPAPNDAEERDPTDEVVFVERRQRLDPASVLDLDKELGLLPVSDSPHTLDPIDAPAAYAVRDNTSESFEVDPVMAHEFDQRAIEHAEAVVAAIDAAAQSKLQNAATPDPRVSEIETDPTPNDGETAPRPQLELLPDPVPIEPAYAEEGTEPSILEPLPTQSEEADAQQHDSKTTAEVKVAEIRAAARPSSPETPAAIDSLRACLEHHLSRVAELSPAFDTFIKRAFTPELREALPLAAEELLASAGKQGRIQQREYTFDRVRYVICGVPSVMDDAQGLFADAFGGFTRLLTEQLQAESFHANRCEILAILSFGAAPQPWVSLSIVPDEEQDPRIDLLSYEFLTESERHEIGPSIDPKISQSGLA